MCICLFCILLCLKTNCVRCSFVHVLVQKKKKKRRKEINSQNINIQNLRNQRRAERHAKGLREFGELAKTHASIDLSRGKRHTFVEFINNNPTVRITDAMREVLDRIPRTYRSDRNKRLLREEAKEALAQYRRENPNADQDLAAIAALSNDARIQWLNARNITSVAFRNLYDAQREELSVAFQDAGTSVDDLTKKVNSIAQETFAYLKTTLLAANGEKRASQ